MKPLRALILAFLVGVPSSGMAATVAVPQAGGGSLFATLGGIDGEALARADQSRSTVLPKGASWVTAPWTLPSAEFGIDPALGVVSDPCQNACSPYYQGIFGAYDPAVGGPEGWQTTPFWAVFDPHSTGPWINSALLSFARPQGVLSLLWGSPDGSNMLELLLGGQVVATFWGADFGWFTGSDILRQPGSGAALLRLSGARFDGVRFSSWANGGTFEFSNVTTSPVPLPPAALLLLGAVGTLAMLRRRRA